MFKKRKSLFFVLVLLFTLNFSLIANALDTTKPYHTANQIDFSSGITGNVNVNGNLLAGGILYTTQLCLPGMTTCYTHADQICKAGTCSGSNACAFPTPGYTDCKLGGTKPNGYCSNGMCGCSLFVCDNTVCGTVSDKCGGTMSCSCNSGKICQNGACVTCTPSCSGKVCGDDNGCGGTCSAGSGCCTNECTLNAEEHNCASEAAPKARGTRTCRTDVDSDICTEWSSWSYAECSWGETCVDATATCTTCGLSLSCGSWGSCSYTSLTPFILYRGTQTRTCTSTACGWSQVDTESKGCQCNPGDSVCSIWSDTNTLSTAYVCGSDYTFATGTKDGCSYSFDDGVTGTTTCSMSGGTAHCPDMQESTALGDCWSYDQGITCTQACLNDWGSSYHCLSAHYGLSSCDEEPPWKMTCPGGDVNTWLCICIGS